MLGKINHSLLYERTLSKLSIFESNELFTVNRI